jgi:hypothetical protein
MTQQVAAAARGHSKRLQKAGARRVWIGMIANQKSGAMEKKCGFLTVFRKIFFCGSALDAARNEMV